MKKLKKIVSVIIVIAVVAGFAAVPMTANTSVNDAKDLLQAFVTQCKTNITQAILNDSGSTGSKNYTRALMYSETVLSKGSATVEEYITAYYMLRTASSEEHLYTRTWEELTALHESVKPIFDSQNRLHADDDGSQKYTPLTYTRFSAAYEEKTHIQTWQQGQKQYITDVYDRLEFAVDNLIENEIVSKTDFHELRVKLQNLAIMERNRFTDERRPRNFDRDHDHINILNYHELIGFFRSCADCEDKEAADGSIDGGARWGTAWLWYDFYHTAFFTASPIIWDLTTNETTSHFTVVNSYLNMQIIYDYITWFLTNADQYQQATLSNYKTLMDQYHDLIVNADNGLRSLTDDPEEFDAFVYLAAERNPRDGIGALAALYAQIEDELAGTGFAWVAPIGAGTIPNRPNLPLYLVIDGHTKAYKRAATGLSPPVPMPDEQVVQFPAQSIPDLRPYVWIRLFSIGMVAEDYQIVLPGCLNPYITCFDYFTRMEDSPRNAENIDLINFFGMNLWLRTFKAWPRYLDEVMHIYRLALEVDQAANDAARDDILENFWIDVTTNLVGVEGLNVSGDLSSPPLRTDTGLRAFGYRSILYTLEDYDFPNFELVETWDNLNNLRGTANELLIRNSGIPHFAGFLFDINTCVNNAALVLAQGRYTPDEIANRIAGRAWRAAFIALENAIDAFEREWNRWPYSMREAYELILQAHETGNPAFIALADNLALELIASESTNFWISATNGSDWRPNGRLTRLVIFDGELTRERRAFLAYEALLNAMGGGPGPGPGGFTFGDLNDDGVIGPADSILMAQYRANLQGGSFNLLATPSGKFVEAAVFIAGNVNSAGAPVVGGQDAIMLAQYRANQAAIAQGGTPPFTNTGKAGQPG